MDSHRDHLQPVFTPKPAMTIAPGLENHLPVGAAPPWQPPHEADGSRRQAFVPADVQRRRERLPSRTRLTMSALGVSHRLGSLASPAANQAGWTDCPDSRYRYM